MHRRLAAILVADVVGFSRLAEFDEEGTLAALRRLRLEVLEPLIVDHAGRIVKLLGDGLIAEFGSVVGAISCAALCQSKLAADQETVPAERRIVVRMGLNLGDVVAEGDDLLGDGVNIASRLEQLCEPGGLLISGTAYDQIHGKLEISFAYLGEQRLKNIARPIRAYQMVVEGSPPPALHNAGDDRPVVAVLPFDNLSGDPDQLYFSDGMTEEVVTELSRFRELTVIARHSSSVFRGKGMDIREIGQKLGAAYIVEGSVRRAANRVRISAQLLEVVSGANLWADRYDRPMEDVFAIQEEIGQNIVAKVAMRVRDDTDMRGRRRRPEDLRAYDLYIQGNYLTDDWRPEPQARSELLFEEARRLDPSFARAYTGLAFIHLNRTLARGMWTPAHPDENSLSALKLAETALELDPNDARVHSTLGFVCIYVNQVSRAERHLNLARSMNPNDPTIQMFWAWVQGCLGMPERGMEAIDTAMRINPHHPRWYETFLARLLFQLRRYDEAAVLLAKASSPSPARSLRDIGWHTAALGHLGRHDEARQSAQRFVDTATPLWLGSTAAGPKEFVDWLIAVSALQQQADIDNLRQGLRLAGLPA